MNGMNAHTGRAISGVDHLKQSIIDILTTPIGTRVMRRNYGSRLYQLVDAPMNNATLVDLYSATAEALAQWEPRFRLSRVQTDNAAPGAVVLSLQGEYVPEGRVINLDGIQVS